MAKFQIKIIKDDETVVDDVEAIIPDVTIDYMVAASNDLGHSNADGELITGGRAITYGIRHYLTTLVKDYASREAARLAQAQAQQAVNELLNQIEIIDGEV